MRELYNSTENSNLTQYNIVTVIDLKFQLKGKLYSWNVPL